MAEEHLKRYCFVTQAACVCIIHHAVLVNENMITGTWRIESSCLFDLRFGAVSRGAVCSSPASDGGFPCGVRRVTVVDLTFPIDSVNVAGVVVDEVT